VTLGVPSVPATRRIIGVGPTTRVSARDRVYSIPPFMYIKTTHRKHCSQQTRIYNSSTPPFIDE
jgi:hypothetical protein